MVNSLAELSKQFTKDSLELTTEFNNNQIECMSLTSAKDVTSSIRRVTNEYQRELSELVSI